MADDDTIRTRCCIAGGGPAGIMLGYLMARAGIDATVLERWPDFFRDFRGDTIHPASMDILNELGLLDSFLKLHHNETRRLFAFVGADKVILADFTHVPARCRFIAFLPQWDFLNFIVKEAKRFSTFHLLLETEAVDYIREGERAVGVVARSKDRDIRIQAELVVGADGRDSTLRQQAHCDVEKLGAPMDVLWFRLSRKPDDPDTSLGRINYGKMMVMIDRDDYWQCGFLIRKGTLDDIRGKGLANFRIDIVRIAPFLSDRVCEIENWDAVKLLTVEVDRLVKWYQDGLLFIGDAAHAMSPIGGVGINYAIQDAVAAANILIPKMQHGKIVVSDLEAVQKRRELPTRRMQRLQVLIQHNVIEKALSGDKPSKMPWYLKLLLKTPGINRIPGRIIGIGFQRERITHIAKPQPDPSATLSSPAESH